MQKTCLDFIEKANKKKFNKKLKSKNENGGKEKDKTISMDPKKRGAMDREPKHVVVGWLIIFVEKHKKKKLKMIQFFWSTWKIKLHENKIKWC